MNNYPLIVLGMHRSGTSLTAQWLHACGFDLGYRLMGKHSSNIKGHYEDLDFLELHQEILTHNNMAANGLEGDLTNITLSEYHKLKMKYLCNLKKELNPQFAWKEPRTCLFINYYKEIMPEAKVLVVFRNLAEVRTSLINRELNEIEKRIKNSRLRKRIRYRLFRKKLRMKYCTILNEKYIKTSLFYHQQIIDFIEISQSNDIVICELNQTIKDNSTVFKKFSNWGFTFKKIRFSDVVQNELLNKRIKELEKFSTITPEEESLYIKLQKLSS